MSETKLQSQKLIFVDSLRAVATVMVLLWHLGNIFWFNNAAVSNLCHIDIISNISDMIPKWYSDINDALNRLNLDFGMFGVSIFFLISGFIVPFSVNRAKITAVSFLKKRFIRIYPLYIVCFTITFLLVSFYVYFNTGIYPYSIKDYLVQVSLLRDWFWVSSIDGISWTLEIEIKFYVLYAVLMLIKKKNNPKIIGGISIITAILCVLYNSNQNLILQMSRNVYIVLGVLAASMMYIVFIFIGLSIYEFYEGNWGKDKFFIVLQVLIVSFLICVLNSSSSELIIKFIINYGGGLVLFLNFYMLKTQIDENIILKFFAKYSYIIYLIHGVNGYILMDFLVKKGTPFWFCLVITVGIVLIGCILIGNLVEKPINSFFIKWVRERKER